MTAPTIKPTYIYRVSEAEKALAVANKQACEELLVSWEKTAKDMLVSRQAQANFPVTINVCFPDSDDVLVSVVGEPKKDWTHE